MSALKGILYASGNIDFPRELNQWAFARMQAMRTEQEKRVVFNPAIAPVELSRAAGVEQETTGWLERLQDIVNASSSVNLLRREETLRLRKAVHTIDDQSGIVTLVSQEAFDEFCREHWERVSYFYASRHDGFRFDMVTLISLRDGEPDRENRLELNARVVAMPDHDLPFLTFDATGSAAPVAIVDWRGTVEEGESGRFRVDDCQVSLRTPQVKVPLTFLYEVREEFRNRAYHFQGEKLERQLKRAIRKSASARD